MPYGIQNRDYYGSMERGRVDADQAVRRKQVNALGQLDVQQAQRFNALSQDPNATAEQFARVGETGVANSLTNIGNNNRQNQQLDAQRLLLAAEYGIRSKQPKAFLQQNFPEIVALNQNFANETDEQVRASLQELRGRFGPQAGIAPAPEPVKWSERKGPRGSLLMQNPETGEIKQVVGPDNSQPSTAGPSRFRPMSVDEKRRAGLPENASAQIDESTGKIDVLSQPPKPNVSPKDITTIKSKLVQLNVARRQIADVRKAWLEIKNSAVAGPGGQGRVPSPKGNAFDRAVDRMRGTITALTRVPGIGSMSDWEGKLDQAKFPDRTDWEDVTEDQIAGIESLLNEIDGGYKDILSGNDAVGSVAPQAAPQAQGPVRVRTREEAMALPSGTQFITPDGRVKVRP